jgi:formylmethanofuran dehydrogenase subunit E
MNKQRTEGFHSFLCPLEPKGYDMEKIAAMQIRSLLWKKLQLPHQCQGK